MHAIEHPHLPRVGLMALGALLLAIIVLLLAASRIGGIGANSTSATSGAATIQAAAVHRPGSAGPSWYANPFASPFHVVARWAKPAGR